MLGRVQGFQLLVVSEHLGVVFMVLRMVLRTRRYCGSLLQDAKGA